MVFIRVEKRTHKYTSHVYAKYAGGNKGKNSQIQQASVDAHNNIDYNLCINVV